MITIDNLASRYHLLPSDVLSKANSFDLEVLNISSRWERHKFEQQNPDIKKESPKLSVEQMQEMLNKVKNK